FRFPFVACGACGAWAVAICVAIATRVASHPATRRAREEYRVRVAQDGIEDVLLAAQLGLPLDQLRLNREIYRRGERHHVAGARTPDARREDHPQLLWRRPGALRGELAEGR